MVEQRDLLTVRTDEIKKECKVTSLVVQWLRIACQCRGRRFNPRSSKIPHAVGQLSPHATSTEACTL